MGEAAQVQDPLRHFSNLRESLKMNHLHNTLTEKTITL